MTWHRLAHDVGSRLTGGADWRRLLVAIVVYLTTSLIVVLAVLRASPRSAASESERRWEWFQGFDGSRYAQIATVGYDYAPRQASTVAWFPGYPVIASAVRAVTRWPIAVALLVTAHVSLLAAFVAFSAYLHARLPATPRASRTSPAIYTLLAFGLVPATFFFRVAYSEALFLACSILTLYAMERRWPLGVIATIVGLATGTRAVGVALLAPLTMHIWARSATTKEFSRRIACLLPFACWGLLAFMVFQHRAFGDGLAFAKAQADWRLRAPLGFGEKCLALASWEPIWSVYDPSSPAYWRHFSGRANPWTSLQFANPIYLVGAVALVSLGAWRGWLSRYEVTYSALAISIVYWTRSFEMSMHGQARFAVAVFPIYIVLGHLLFRLPSVAAWLLLAAAPCQLYIYANRFAAGYAFY